MWRCDYRTVTVYSDLMTKGAEAIWRAVGQGIGQNPVTALAVIHVDITRTATVRAADEELVASQCNHRTKKVIFYRVIPRQLRLLRPLIPVADKNIHHTRIFDGCVFIRSPRYQRIALQIKVATKAIVVQNIGFQDCL